MTLVLFSKAKEAFVITYSHSVRIPILSFMGTHTYTFYISYNPSPHHVPLAILYYDYLLTLSDERRFFWKSISRSKWSSGGIRRTWGSTLFLVTRYLSIFGNVPVALQNFRVWTPDVSLKRGSFDYLKRHLRLYTFSFSFVVVCTLYLVEDEEIISYLF